MTDKKTIDLEKLKIIDEGEVPAKPMRYTPYREMLKRIRRGKAMIISEQELNVDTVRAGIKRLQRRGEFKKLQLRQLKGEDGIQRLYIINPSEEETEKKSYRLVHKE